MIVKKLFMNLEYFYTKDIRKNSFYQGLEYALNQWIL